MKLRLAAAALTALALAAAPVVARAANWTDAGARAPATVDLRAVSAGGIGGNDLVVAVGRDAGTHRAVIYRYAGGSWQTDALAVSGTTPADSCLVSVAVTGQAAWAVGSQNGGCPGDTTPGSPLLVYFPGGGQALASQSGPASWTVASPDPAGLATPTAVALNGNQGFVGDATGKLFSLTDNTSAPNTPSQQPFTLNQASFTTPSGQTAPSAGPTTISAIALDGPQTGYAVGAGPGGADVYSLSSSGGTPAAFTASASSVPLSAVAAMPPHSSNQAIAIEGSGGIPGWWAPNAGGVWQRASSDTFVGAALGAVSIAADPAGPVAAIAGSDSFGHGAVWQRAGAAAFTQTIVACAPLRGVAVLAAGDMWAVGDGGTVLRYAASGAPAGCVAGSSGTQSDGSSPGSGSSAGSGSVAGSGSTPAPSPAPGSGSGSAPATGGSSGQPSNSGPAVTVSQPPKPAPGTTSGKKRHHPAVALMRDVRVKVRRGQLTVLCKLSAPARVSAVATRGADTVGRAGWQKFFGSTCRLVVPFQGTRPPTGLKIFALALPASSPGQARPRHAAGINGTRSRRHSAP